MNKIFLGLSVALLAACSVKLMPPTQSDVDRVSNKYPGYTLAQLNEGKTLFEQKCTQCHGLKNPASRDEAKWKQLIPIMAQRAEKKESASKIDPQSQVLILQYLVTMGSAGKGK